MELRYKYHFMDPIQNQESEKTSCDISDRQYFAYKESIIVQIRPPDNINRIFVLFGNPGAGKSSGLKNALEFYGLKKENCFHLDPDEIRYYCGTYLADINGITYFNALPVDDKRHYKTIQIDPPNGDPELSISGYLDTRTNTIPAMKNATNKTLESVREFIDNSYSKINNYNNIIFDVSCNDYKWCTESLQKIFPNHHKIYIGIITHPLISYKRALDRSTNDGRFMDLTYLEKYTNNITFYETYYDKLKQNDLFDIIIYNNSDKLSLRKKKIGREKQNDYDESLRTDYDTSIDAMILILQNSKKQDSEPHNPSQQGGSIMTHDIYKKKYAKYKTKYMNMKYN